MVWSESTSARVVDLRWGLCYASATLARPRVLRSGALSLLVQQYFTALDSVLAQLGLA